jgi:hypothetical protein
MTPERIIPEVPPMECLPVSRLPDETEQVFAPKKPKPVKGKVSSASKAKSAAEQDSTKKATARKKAA